MFVQIDTWETRGNILEVTYNTLYECLQYIARVELGLSIGIESERCHAWRHNLNSRMY